MIKEIIIEYFQNHKKTSIAVAKHLTVILGSSDQGKSSVQRAIDWIKNNSPSGASFKHRKFKEKTTKSILVLSDGRIEKGRKGSTNYYKINNEKPLKALKAKVPEEVSTLLNISDINVQNQFDKFFLLQESSGQVAKTFNEYVGLSLIDAVQKEAERTVRIYGREVHTHETEAKKLKKELKKYDGLDEAEKLIKKGTVLNDQIRDISELLSFVNDRLGIYYSQKRKLELLPNIKVLQDEFDSATRLQTRLTKTETKLDQVEALTRLHTQFNFRLKAFKNFPKIEKAITQARQIQKSLKDCDRSLIEVTEYHDSYTQLLTIAEQNKRTTAKLKIKIDKVHKKLKYCPLCKQKIGGLSWQERGKNI